MSHFPDLSTMPSGETGHLYPNDAELEVLCGRIRNAEGASAKLLPAQILSYLATNLSRIEIDIHVEECLPMVCDASHAFVRAMGTFSARHADCEAVEQMRSRLIQALETLADEMRLCDVLSDPRSRISVGLNAMGLGSVVPIVRSSPDPCKAPNSLELFRVVIVGNCLRVGQQCGEDDMEDDREEQIRQRAYTIWEEQGRPYGEDMRHWLRAWQEILDSNVAPEDAAVPALSDAGAEAVEPSPTSFNTVAAVAKGRKKKSNR